MIVDFTFAGTPLYSPPKRAVVNFTWATLQAEFKFPGSSYVPSPGNDVRFSWQAGPHPIGFIGTIWGGAAVMLDTLKIRPIGLSAQLFGLPDLDWTLWITPGGKSHMLFGTTKAYNLKQEIKPAGLVASKYGVATVRNMLQIIRPSGLVASKYGTLYAYRLLQRAWPTGFIASKFGLPLGDNLRQHVRPSGFSAGLFGTANPYNMRQRVLPGGLTATLVGLHNTYNLKRYVNASGAKHTAFGTQFIQLMSITPTGWRAIPKIGAAKAYNKTSIIAPGGRTWDVFGSGMHVDLHKFTIAGLIHTKWGIPLAKNALQFVTPHPTIYSRWGRPWCSNKHRRVTQYYTLVWLEQPDGSYDYSYPVHTKWGAPLATHKHIKPAGLKATKWGATWISGPQYIEPLGVFDLFMGNKHDVSSTIRDITPYWTDLGQFGEASMSPLYIKPKGEKETLWTYGYPRVGGKEIKAAKVGLTQRFGTPFASFNPRYVYPTPVSVGAAKFGNPPYGVMHTFIQFVRPPLLLAEKWGREPWDYRLGLHIVYKDRRLLDGFIASRFGGPTAMDGARWAWENTRLSKVRFEL